MNMERDFDRYLAGWKGRNSRKPLIIRGARQTGKTYAVRKLGATFERFIEINFEKSPQYKEAFRENLEPKRICREISIVCGTEIESGKTLLFFDEIQNCPAAITSLRYFFEEMPQLHVISAGSLLEFALGLVSIPVGRVEYAYLRPLSFREFLLVSGNEVLEKSLAFPDFGNAAHLKALQIVREYFFVGGMPRVVDRYLANRSFLDVRDEQRDIIQTYRDDFLKYSKSGQIGNISTVFNAIPTMVGEKTVYSKIDSQAHPYQIRGAIELLEKAQVVTKVLSAKASGIPLSVGIKSGHYKTIFIDIGLMHCVCAITPESFWGARELLDIFRGAAAEQFVGQELLALAGFNANEGLYYWHRDRAGSQAEVDYVVQIGDELVPVEVKSGSAGKLRSIHQFMIHYPAVSRAIKISQAPFEITSTIVSVPLYSVGSLGKLWHSENQKSKR